MTKQMFRKRSSPEERGHEIISKGGERIKNRFMVGFCETVVLLLGALLFYSTLVRADMAPPYSFYSNTPIVGILFISIMNISINMFWFSLLLLLMCNKFGGKVGIVPENRQKFLIKILAVSIIITLAGACIDLFLLYEKGRNYELTFNTIRWSVAALLIFILIYFTSFIILKINWKLNLIPSGVIAILNPIWWFLILESEDGAPCWALFIFILFLPVIFFYLGRWHKGQYPLPFDGFEHEG
jgi:hypothetical protein